MSTTYRVHCMCKVQRVHCHVLEKKHGKFTLYLYIVEELNRYLCKAVYCSHVWNCVICLSVRREDFNTSAILGFHPPWPSCICRRMSTSKRHLTLSPCWKEWPSALSWRCSSACSPGWTSVSINKWADTSNPTSRACIYFLQTFIFTSLQCLKMSCNRNTKHCNNTGLFFRLAPENKDLQTVTQYVFDSCCEMHNLASKECILETIICLSYLILEGGLCNRSLLGRQTRI